MTEHTPEAWVQLPSDEELQAMKPPPASTFEPGYDFGFAPNMSRLLRASPRIGFKFGALFAEVMFAPGVLTRVEKEMVAAVAAAAQDCHY
ncbi:MAG: hypothetical protein ACE5EF_11220 [Dehalococcoidia bacterium]